MVTWEIYIGDHGHLAYTTIITINMWHIYRMSGSIFDMYIDFHGRYLVYIYLFVLYVCLSKKISH
jgi:hypothetical protein